VGGESSWSRGITWLKQKRRQEAKNIILEKVNPIAAYRPTLVIKPKLARQTRRRKKKEKERLWYLRRKKKTTTEGSMKKI